MAENSLQQIVENPLEKGVRQQKWASIIGLNPSKGARSPILWNATFRSLSVCGRMIALDVKPENLTRLMTVLEADANYIGGAVAAPYKELIADHLGVNHLTPEAAAIGAVNCLFRDNVGRLSATNTDGEGALNSLVATSGSLQNRRILLLGSGGTARSVAAYFARSLGPAGKLVISARNWDRACELGVKHSVVCANWPPQRKWIEECDLLVNCTSVGSGDQFGLCPLDLQLLEHLPPNTLVFDVIYQPPETALLAACRELGFKTLNGAGMNLEQAVLGFYNTLRGSISIDQIRTSMIEATRYLK